MKQAETGTAKKEDSARKVVAATPITDEEAKGVVGGTNSDPVPDSEPGVEPALGD